jgi:pimeloyl-ACP methyl ester carboxylesterase
MLLVTAGRPALAGELERQITFQGAGGVMLQGTLVVPDGPGRFPAVLLLPGSGATDRNGDQVGHKLGLLKSVADALATQGVASLRYDKRGVSSTAPIPSDPDQAKAFLRWSSYEDDAVRAYLALGGQKDIDARRVGIFGHSEGGLLAIAAAQTLSTQGHAPATVILASTPGRTPDLVLRDQLVQVMERRGMAPEASARFLADEDRITTQLRDHDSLPADVPPGLAPLFPPNLIEFWHEELAFDPVAMIARYAGPVLVLQGAADHQVSPDKDALALDRALAARPGDHHRLVLLADVGHPLQAIGGPSPPEPGMAPPVLKAIEEWVGAHLVATTG